MSHDGDRGRTLVVDEEPVRDAPAAG